MELSGLLEDLRERLRPIRARMFPQQVLLELHDQNLRGQALVDGRPGPLTIDVQLPALTCRRGMPLEKEPLGDLIGDLLVRDNLIDAFVMAALPPAAVQWRVLEWPEPELPEDPVEALRALNPPLNLPYPLVEANLDLKSLPGKKPRMLLAAAPQNLVEAWIQVFNLAGAQLDRLAPAQSCQLAALGPLLSTTSRQDLVALVDPGLDGARLLLVREGVPVFEHSLPEGGLALANEVRRCVEFYRRQDPAARDLRLLLAEPMEARNVLETQLEVEAEELSPEPFGSLVLQGLATPEREGSP